MNRTRQIAALLEAWMIQTIFGRTRSAGESGSGSLTPTVFSQGFFSWAFAAIAFEGSSPRAFLAGTMSFVVLLSTIALVGELDDERERPADRDLVRSGPIAARTFYLARFLRQGLVTLAYAGGLAIAPAVLSGFKTGDAFLVPLSFLVATCILSSSMSALLGASTRVVARVLGPDRASSFSSLVRATLLGGGFLAILVGLRAMLSGPQHFPGGRELLSVLPMTLAADAILTPGLVTFALALAFPLGVALLSGTTMTWSSRTTSPSRRARSPLQSLLSLLIRDPRRLGVASFSLTMLARERSFRLRALPLLGLPAAAVVLALRADLTPGKLSWLLALVHQLPLAYLPFLLWFMPYAEESRASWLVQMRVADPLRAYRRDLEIAIALIYVPVQMALFVVDISLRSFDVALCSSLAALGVAWLILPALMSELRRPAFSEDPDALEIPSDFGPSLALALAACGAAFFIDIAYRRYGALPAMLAFGLGAVALHRRARRHAAPHAARDARP